MPFELANAHQSNLVSMDFLTNIREQLFQMGL